MEIIYGVLVRNQIFYRKGLCGMWIQVGGGLKQISVSRDGSHVWGVNSGDKIYYRKGFINIFNHWRRISGRLKHVSVSGDGNHIWGYVNKRDDYIYYRNGVNGRWIRVPGGLSQISVSDDGNHVWGVNKHGLIYDLDI